MRNFLLCALLVLLMLTTAQAQHWYDQSARSLQIVVNKDAIYKLTGRQVALGQIGGQATSGYKLYLRGKEQALKIFDGGDGRLDDADSILFYGMQNLPVDEAECYQKQAFANPYQSIYSDNSYYYLVWSPQPGLRIVNQDTASTGANTTEFLAQVIQVNYRMEYSTGVGAFQYSKVHQSFVGPGEGWGSASSRFPTLTPIVGPSAPAPGTNAKIKFSVFGRSASNHAASLTVDGGASIKNIAFDYYNRYEDSASVQANSFSGIFNLKLLASQQYDYLSVGYYRLWIPCKISSSDTTPIRFYETARGGNGRLAFSFANQVSEGMWWNVTQADKPQVVRTNRSKLVVSRTDTTVGRLVYQRRTQAIGDSDLIATEYTPLQPVREGNYLIIISHALSDSANAYALYRSSTAGGGLNPVVQYVEDIYQKYTHGFKGPVALKRYLQDIVTSNALPKSVFLLGKGIENTEIHNAFDERKNLLPTFGVPASDYWYFTSGVGDFKNIVPFGRLAANTNTEVGVYLSKIKEHEKPEALLSRKRLYHLSGGRTDIELEQFKRYMNDYTDSAASPVIGAEALRYTKQTTSFVEQVSIKDALNKGLGMINMFGHSAATATDIDIGYANDPHQGFTNTGKYPFILINGCYSGNIFSSSSNSLNESWVFTPRLGAIAFAGSMDEGLPPLLDRFNRHFYSYQFVDSTTSSLSLGKIFTLTSASYIATPPSIFDSVMVSQTVLHGDPELTLYPLPKANYLYAGEKAVIREQNIIGTNNSLVVRLTIQNTGRYYKNDTLTVIGKIEGGGRGLFYGRPIKIGPLRIDTTIDYSFYGNFNVGTAGASVSFNLNHLETVAETNYDDNVITLQLAPPTQGIRLIAPIQDAIVASNTVSFIVESQQDGNNTLYFQVDTSHTFSSPSLRTWAESQTQIAVSTQEFPFLRDSSVCYWRVRLGNDTGSKWSAIQAFTVIAGLQGWSQSTPFQYLNNTLEAERIDTTGAHPVWHYTDRKRTKILLRTTGDRIVVNYDNHKIDIDSIPYYYGTQSTCADYSNLNVMHMLRLRENTLEPYVFPWQQPFDEFWRYGCGRLPIAINYYNADMPATNYNFFQFGIAQAHPGDYVFVLSQGKHNYNSWAPTTFGALPYIGADTGAIRNNPTGAPLIIVGRRSRDATVGQAVTLVANTTTDTTGPSRQTLTYETTIVSQARFGSVSTGIIGPASRWGKFQLYGDTITHTDTLKVEIFGLRFRNDSPRLLNTDTIIGGYDLSNLITSAYPFVQIRISSVSTVGGLPLNIKSWRVFYIPVPEGAVKDLQLVSNNVAVGDSIRAYAKFINVLGHVQKDTTFPVRFSLVKRSGEVLEDTLLYIQCSLNQDTINFHHSFVASVHYPDTAIVSCYANPELLPEQLYENNRLQVPIYLPKDTIAPVITMLINGIEIEDGSIVPSSATISVIASENNTEFPLTQTSCGLTFNLDCDTCHKYNIDSQYLQMSKLPDGKVRYDYTNLDMNPGEYFTTATVADYQGNRSYSVNKRFRVSATDSITSLNVIPNPLTNVGRFALEISGKRTPISATFSISNAYGQTVYETDVDQLHIGKMISKEWNTRDKNGLKLPSGIYIVAVRVLFNNENAVQNKSIRFVLYTN